MTACADLIQVIPALRGARAPLRPGNHVVGWAAPLAIAVWAGAASTSSRVGAETYRQRCRERIGVARWRGRACAISSETTNGNRLNKDSSKPNSSHLVWWNPKGTGIGVKQQQDHLRDLPMPSEVFAYPAEIAFWRTLSCSQQLTHTIG